MIEAKSLVKKFGNFTALDAVNLKIQPGSVFGLVGSNGSGKSTLLRTASGIYRPDDGELLIDGEAPLDNCRLKERLFFLSDTPCFFHQANLLEMAAFYNKVYARFSYEKFNYLTTVFPISTKARIQTMSKGMQRQAALMLALSVLPDYLFMDEAFDGLDPVIRGVLKRLLADGISERGMTVIIASHNLRELEDMCDHVGLLHKGKIVFNDELDNLKNRLHKVQLAFAGEIDRSAFDGLDILKIERQGSLIRLIVRGEEAEILARLRALNPVFMKSLSPTLEELFIFELEVAGYDVQNIIG